MESTAALNEAGSSNENIARYTVQSSDVLSDMRINIFQEGSETVIWYKERFLGDEEIIDHIVENANTKIHWTVHRPKRGWYLRMRSPSFPPGSYVNLTPLPEYSPYKSEATLSFACRTSPRPMYQAGSVDTSPLLDSQVTLTDDTPEAGMHSYPPTPPPQHPIVRVHPPSPQSIASRLSEAPLSRSIPPDDISHFVLTPLSNTVEPAAQPSFFSRVLSAIKSSAPSTSSSFTMSPIPPPGTYTQGSIAATPIPLLTYYDQTPVFTVNSIHGTIEIDKKCEYAYGVPTSFWVAIALTYLDFLTERDSYIASEAA